MDDGENLLPRSLPMVLLRLAFACRKVDRDRLDQLRPSLETVRAWEASVLGPRRGGPSYLPHALVRAVGTGLPSHLDDPLNRALLSLAFGPAARLGSSSRPDPAQRSVPIDSSRTEDPNRAAAPRIARRDYQQVSPHRMLADSAADGQSEPLLAAPDTDSPHR